MPWFSQGWGKPAQGPIDVVDLKVGADITVVAEPEAPQPPSAEAAGAGPAVEAAPAASGAPAAPLVKSFRAQEDRAPLG